MSDYYNILGVNRDASPDDIKRAYRKLASHNHPDKGGDTKRFQEIQVAYDTLSDPQKRSEYDRPQPQFNGGGPGGFHFNFGDGMPPGFEQVFAHFGGRNPFEDMFGQQQRQQLNRNRTLNLQAQISLEDAFHGKDLVANIGLPSGREQVVEVRIPPGVHEGTVLRLNGMGDDSIPNLPRGDIHLTIHISEHSFFARRDDDLIAVIDLNCLEAILGTTLEVESINGSTLEINVHPGTQHGQMLAVHGYGMPNLQNNNIKGKLLLQINITVPTNLSDTHKDLLRQIVS
jgi:curved DNA-binding protein